MKDAPLLVGIDITAGDFDGLPQFEQTLYGETGNSRLPQGSWGELGADALAMLGISAREVESAPLEERLLLRVTARALIDAGVEPGLPSTRMALFYSLGQDLARQAAEASGQEVPRRSPARDTFPFAVELTNLSAEPHPLAAGLLRALDLFREGVVDLVVLAGVCLLEDFVGLAQFGAAGNGAGSTTLGLDQSVTGWRFGEGAAAVVLARADWPGAYARIDGLGWAPRDLPGLRKNLFPTLLSADVVAQAAEMAFQAARIDSHEVGALEIQAGGHAALDGSEMAGLGRVYRAREGHLTIALGGAGAYLFNVHGLLGLARAALSLAQRRLPASPGWSAPKREEWLAGTPFYVNGEPRSWFTGGKERRRAGLNAIGRDGSCLHLLLAEAAAPGRVAHSHSWAWQAIRLLVVAGDGPGELMQRLAELRATPANLSELTSPAYQAYNGMEQAPYALGLVVASTDELQREIDYAQRDLLSAFERGQAWQTPAGSYCTPQPVGGQGEVAFVYPGAFNSYPGLARDLFQLFPQLWPKAEELTANLSEMIHERLLYPRSQHALSKEELAERETQLAANPVAMLTSGSLIAALYTVVVRDLFRVRPAAAFGYSLGEIAMLFGAGVWRDSDETSAALSASPLFHSRLAGSMDAVRERWAVSDPPHELWANYFLMAGPEHVRPALADEQRVYLTHVNTPRQVVIGGDPVACQRVIKRLGCASLKAPFDFALHCEAIASELSALTELHSWPVHAKGAPRLYTALDAALLPLEREAIAERIGRMLSSSLDFPRLVRRVYDDGARVFIELGANANCTRWIEETLKGRPFLAAAVNRKGADDATSILRLLARLVSHRVPVDLAVLYE